MDATLVKPNLLALEFETEGEASMAAVALNESPYGKKRVGIRRGKVVITTGPFQILVSLFERITFCAAVKIRFPTPGEIGQFKRGQ